MNTTTRVERLPTVDHRLCWYCAKPLGAKFTSVDKNGDTLLVHYPCRPGAIALTEGRCVEDQPDYGEHAAPIERAGVTGKPGAHDRTTHPHVKPQVSPRVTVGGAGSFRREGAR